MTTPHAVYIHIPFCRERCTYCAFNTYTDRAALMDDYVAAVVEELRAVGMAASGQRLPVHTLYFGGGTPSLLKPGQIATLIEAATEQFALTPDIEISLEANPGTVDEAAFRALRAAGVTRFSLGVQSAHAAELSLFGRLHGWAEVVEAVEAARRARVDNLSLDLIYGVPHQTLEMWAASLARVLSLEPDHLSLYALGLESGTEMTRRVTYGQLPEPDPDLTADMYDLATDRLAAAGFVQYEISNWGRPGTFCRHNLQYWRNLPYIGCGAGAHGYVGGWRTVNAMRPEDYIQRVAAGQRRAPWPVSSAAIRAVRIDPATDRFETIFMGLRLLDEGLSLAAYAERYGERLENVFAAEIAALSAHGLLRRRGDRLFLTRRARLISNQVFNRFLQTARSAAPGG